MSMDLTLAVNLKNNTASAANQVINSLHRTTTAAHEMGGALKKAGQDASQGMGQAGTATVRSSQLILNAALRISASANSTGQSWLNAGALFSRGAAIIESGARRVFDTLITGSKLAGTALATAFALTAKNGVDVNVTVERVANSLTVLTRSASTAASLLADLRKEALTSAFEFTGLAQFSQRLLAFGFDAKQVIPILRTLGDTAAGLGGEHGSGELLSRLILALGQVRAKGTLQGEEARQFEEAGVPIREILGIPKGKDFGDMKIDADKAVPALLSGLKARFGGLQNQLVSTIPGIVSNLRDAFDAVSSQVTTGLTRRLQTALQGTLDFLSKLGDSARGQQFLATLSRAFDAAGDAAVYLSGKLPLVVGWLERLAGAGSGAGLGAAFTRGVELAARSIDTMIGLMVQMGTAALPVLLRIGTAVNALGVRFSASFSRISTFITPVLNRLIDLGQFMGEQFLAVFLKAGPTISTILVRIIEGIGGIVGGLSYLGQSASFVNALLTPLVVFGRVVQWAGEHVGGLVEWFKALITEKGVHLFLGNVLALLTTITQQIFDLKGMKAEWDKFWSPEAILDGFDKVGRGVAWLINSAFGLGRVWQLMGRMAQESFRDLGDTVNDLFQDITLGFRMMSLVMGEEMRKGGIKVLDVLKALATALLSNPVTAPMFIGAEHGIARARDMLDAGGQTYATDVMGVAGDMAFNGARRGRREDQKRRDDPDRDLPFWERIGNAFNTPDKAQDDFWKRFQQNRSALMRWLFGNGGTPQPPARPEILYRGSGPGGSSVTTYATRPETPTVPYPAAPGGSGNAASSTQEELEAQVKAIKARLETATKFYPQLAQGIRAQEYVPTLQRLFQQLQAPAPYESTEGRFKREAQSEEVRQQILEATGQSAPRFGRTLDGGLIPLPGGNGRGGGPVTNNFFAGSPQDLEATVRQILAQQGLSPQQIEATVYELIHGWKGRAR